MARTSHQAHPASEPAKAGGPRDALPIPQHGALMNWSGGHPPEHLVQFYETDAFLLQTAGDFIGAGLGAGAACLVFATPAHRAGLAQRLQANGLDLAHAQAQGRYLALDAAETLARLLVDGLPDAQSLLQMVNGLIKQETNTQQEVRIFGEMVALLWESGNQAAALQLETLWEDLRKTNDHVALLCSYPVALFGGSEQTDQFTQLCALHSHVIPDESYTQSASQDAQGRVVSLLRQRALSLEAEIAKYQEAQERLRASENRYRRLFESATDGILLVEPESGRITDANPAVLHLLGATREQIIGQELWQVGLLPEEHAQHTFLHKMRQALMLSYELDLTRKDGKPCSVEWVSTLFQANGHQVLQCNIRDLTDRHRAEEARLHLAAIVSSSDDAILSKDLDGILTSWNAAAEQLYGYTAQEMIGQSVKRIYPPDRQEEFFEIMGRLRRGEKVDHFETLRVRKDGSVVPVAATISPIKNRSGTIIGASDITRDISKRKELERQREAFIGLVTHELKTPLTSLQGNIQLAQRRLTRLLSQAEQFTEEQQQTVESVLSMLARSQHSLRVQQRLINDLLDFSHIQEGKVVLDQTMCNLVGLVVETVQDHQAAHPARLVVLDLPEEDPIPVLVDRDRLQQVLSNYLTNALKFSPEAEPVQVGIALEGEAARVWVQDYGPGLSAEQQRLIWGQFYQANTPVQGGWKPGLGLGLYISQQLIHRQQGTVGVESQPGQGATFWFTLPLAHADGV